MSAFWVGLVCLVGGGPVSDVWERSSQGWPGQGLPTRHSNKESGPKRPGRQDGPKRCSSTRRANEESGPIWARWGPVAKCHLGRLGAFLAFLGGILALGHLLSVDLGAQNASFEHLGPENGLETRILSI